MKMRMIKCIHRDVEIGSSVLFGVRMLNIKIEYFYASQSYSLVSLNIMRFVFFFFYISKYLCI